MSCNRTIGRIPGYAFALGLAAALLPASNARAQMSGEDKRVVTYLDYPQIQGKVQPLQWSPLPKWMTLDM